VGLLQPIIQPDRCSAQQFSGGMQVVARVRFRSSVGVIVVIHGPPAASSVRGSRGSSLNMVRRKLRPWLWERTRDFFRVRHRSDIVEPPQVRSCAGRRPLRAKMGHFAR
jgi:hypothetical protein